MDYVKLEDGNITKAPLNYITDDGSTIINFNKDPEVMLVYGYKPLIRAEREPGKDYYVSYEETETEIHEILTERPGPTPEEKAEERERQFDREFFYTSLGYVRRTVHMNEGGEKDFLTALLPNLAIALNNGIQSPVLVYSRPDFTEEIYDWTPYQTKTLVTPQFIQECFLQLSNDFLPNFTPEGEEPVEEPVEENLEDNTENQDSEEGTEGETIEENPEESNA